MKHWFNHPDNSEKTLLLQLSIASKTEGFSLNCANKCLDSLHITCVDTFYNNIYVNIYNLHKYKGEIFQYENDQNLFTATISTLLFYLTF